MPAIGEQAGGLRLVQIGQVHLLHDVPGEDNEYFYEPRGVTVVIAPWNFPLAILCGMTTAALVTGNTVIMKPAEQSSVIAAHLMQLFQEAGFPPGVVNYLPGDGEEIGPTLVEHPDTAVIAFTGSRGVGMSINQQAAALAPGQDHIKRVIAELERNRRGPYCGSIGYIGFDGAMDTSITIRTIVCAGGTASFQVGGGIVADSEPAAEYQETLDKGRALIAALAGGSGEGAR